MPRPSSSWGLRPGQCWDTAYFQTSHLVCDSHAKICKSYINNYPVVNMHTIIHDQLKYQCLHSTHPTSTSVAIVTQPWLAWGLDGILKIQKQTLALRTRMMECRFSRLHHHAPRTGMHGVHRMLYVRAARGRCLQGTTDPPKWNDFRHRKGL